MFYRLTVAALSGGDGARGVLEVSPLLSPRVLAPHIDIRQLRRKGYTAEMLYHCLTLMQDQLFDEVCQLLKGFPLLLEIGPTIIGRPLSFFDVS